MRSFLQILFGVEEMTPEQQLQKIKRLMGLPDSKSDLLEKTIKCPEGQNEVSIRTLLKENKEFLVQALDKKRQELEGEAKQELDYIKDLIKRIEEL